MIRDRCSRHLQLDHSLHNGLNFASPVEQAVVSVQMQVNEFRVFHEKRDKLERRKTQGNAKERSVKGRTDEELKSPLSIFVFRHR